MTDSTHLRAGCGPIEGISSSAGAAVSPLAPLELRARFESATPGASPRGAPTSPIEAVLAAGLELARIDALSRVPAFQAAFA